MVRRLPATDIDEVRVLSCNEANAPARTVLELALATVSAFGVDDLDIRPLSPIQRELAAAGRPGEVPA